MRRAETRDAAAFLVDENRRVLPADDVAKILDQPGDVLWRADIAREQDQAEGAGLLKEGALGVRQRRAGAAEDDRRRPLSGR